MPKYSNEDWQKVLQTLLSIPITRRLQIIKEKYVAKQDCIKLSVQLDCGCELMWKMWKQPLFWKGEDIDILWSSTDLCEVPECQGEINYACHKDYINKRLCGVVLPLLERLTKKT